MFPGIICSTALPLIFDCDGDLAVLEPQTIIDPVNSFATPLEIQHEWYSYE